MYDTINLTMLVATEEQVEAGVIDLPTKDRDALCDLLRFDSVPLPSDILYAVEKIAALCSAAVALRPGIRKAMIDGSPWLTAPLEAALRERGIVPVYSFYTWVLEDIEQEDGTIVKGRECRHLGFIEAVSWGSQRPSLSHGLNLSPQAFGGAQPSQPPSFGQSPHPLPSDKC